MRLGTGSWRLKGGLALSLIAIVTVVLLVGAAPAFAGTVGNWVVQPKGNTTTGIPIIAQASGASDAYPLVASSVVLKIDGATVPRASYTATIGRTSVYVYYNPSPVLTDGLHTFRVEVKDTANRVSSYEWTATVRQPPSAAWISPAPAQTFYSGSPKIVMNLADNTPGTTFTVAGQVRSGSSNGTVVSTFGGTGLPAGSNTFTLPAELVFGNYTLTATVTDAAGNARTLTGTAGRSFTTVTLPAMTVLESCDACHADMKSAHPTPASSDCGVCHPDKVDDHMQGTEYCEDCHWDGWHNNGAGLTVKVTGACFDCHNQNRPDIPRHTAQSAASAHESSCEGCHFTSVIAKHGVTPVGSVYAYQCDVCHGSTRTDVKNAIAADDTVCLGCHSVYHADFDELHVATDPGCVQVECHASTSLTTQHEPYVGAGGLYPEYPNTCSLCHGNMDPDRVPAGASAECASCHPERVADHGYEPAPHVAAPAPGSVELFGNHDGWMGPVGAGVTCESCHNTELGPVHANVCKSCHPNPRSTFSVYGKDCSQGGCHSTYHASGFDHDAVASGNCGVCHDEGAFELYDDPCVGCHPHPDAGDATAPSTTADIPSSIVGVALIDFHVTDGGKVAIGRTFRRLDGAYPTTGDTMQLPASGSHTLEYWSVDQFGNEELPHHTVSFTVTPDSTPPHTTSNVKSAYEGPASIVLSATDASTMGVKGTYYTLNGGAVQAGTSISIAQPTSGSVSYTLEYWSDDHNGNAETRHTANFTVTRDTTPPTSTFGAQAVYRGPTVTIPFTATDTGAGVQQKCFKLDGGSTQFLSPAATNLALTFAIQGPHTVEYWSTDKVGNSEAHRTVSFVVDWTVPTVSSNALTNYPDTGANITITAVDQPPSGASPALTASSG